MLSSLACAVTWVTPSPAYALGTLSVADATVVEGTGGVRTLEFVVSLSVANPLAVTVDFATSDGSAVAPGDYTSASDELTIPAGATSAVIPVTVTTDSFPEPNETLTLTLSNPSIGTSVGDGSATGTITNDDGPPPALSIDDPTIAETDAPGTVDFTVSLASAALQDTSVSYATSSGTATSDDDFGTSSGIAIIPTGETSTLVSVPIVGDELDEADESFTVTLTSPRNATIADATGTATITDDDLAPTVSADEPSAGETDGPTSLVFTVSLDAPSGQTATVDFTTAEGTATPGTDYSATSGTVVFDPGDVSETVSVPVTGDDLDEPDETVLLTLSSPLHAVLPQATSTGTIVDDEPIPTLSIADVSIAEGDDGTTTALVTATLSAPSGQVVSVDAATGAGGTATAGTDFDAAQAELTFAPGTTTQTLSVPIHGDLLDEADETVIASLTNAANATIADGTATLTITDDDATPTLSISDGSIEEGDDGSVQLGLTLTLSAPSGRDVSVSVSTSSGTATGGADFAAQSGTVVDILAGATTAQVPVSVFGDLIDEADETFTVNLAGPTNATISDGSGTATILDDDTGPSLTIDDVSALEGTNPAADTTFGFTVTLSAVSQQTVTVEYSTTGSTATAGATEDFEAATGTVTFTPGQTTRPISINVNRDAHAEPSESFLVVLASPTNASLGDASGTGTILNDDGPPPSLSIADVAVDEDAGVATLTVTLSGIASQPVSVDLATTDGSAGEPDDYAAVAETVTIPSGETTATTDVTIVDDTADEAAETFTATLTTARNASIGDGAATVTITDDDDEPTVSIADVTLVEGAAGVATVSLSSPSFQTVTVHAATSDGTAVGGSDYTAFSTDVTFSPGDTSQQLPVSTMTDVDPEADESFTITLTAPDGATLGDGSASGGITDDDAAGTFTPLEPSRLLDTRSGIGRPGTSLVSPGESVVLDVTGVGGVPTAGVAGVVLNVTVTAPQGSGFITATPAGGDSTSNLNFVAGADVANSVIVPVGPDGNVRLLVSGSPTHVIADVFGFFADDEATTPGSHFTSLVPDRLLDTRIGLGSPGGSTQPLGAGTTGVLDVTGVGGVPTSGVSAVILNVTVTQPTAHTFLSVTPGGGTTTSNINVAAGATATGLVIVPVGDDGSVRYQVGSGTTHVIADVFGWFADPGSLTGSVLSTVEPARLADTRSDGGGPLGPEEQGSLLIEGEGGLPEDGVAAAVLNLTATQPTAQSFLTATPDGEVGTSNLNYTANQTVANLAVVAVHPDFGDVVLYNDAGFVHVIVDVFAWFTTPVE
ncbi:MAG: beta strand repeat-containing protein [Acidimicrobiales bacterium]